MCFSPSPGDSTSSGASSSSSDSSAASASPSSSSDDAASSGAPSSSSPGVSEGPHDAAADAAAAAAAAEEADDNVTGRIRDDSAYDPLGESQSACVRYSNPNKRNILGISLLSHVWVLSGKVGGGRGGQNNNMGTFTSCSKDRINVTC